MRVHELTDSISTTQS